MRARIRRYRAGDLGAVYDVCVRTADAGGDLRPRLDDPRLPGHVYAGPYIVLEPGLAFVVEDGDGVGGYVVGTADTNEFDARMAAEWLPALLDRYPENSGARPTDEAFIHLLHHPPERDGAIVGEYPAHLHIDLLPRLQGRGFGRRLIEGFCRAVRDRGASGVHLGVSTRNTNAIAFYERVGFARLREDAGGLVLGRRLPG